MRLLDPKSLLAQTSLLLLRAAAVITAAMLLLPLPAVTCEICDRVSLTRYDFECRLVDEGETGNEICSTHWELLGTWCETTGPFCESISVIGDGGGGGGGGDNPCDTTGYCPAECFSCNTGGGHVY